MGKTQSNLDESPEGMLIAPHEVRELLSRLTEQSVEGIQYDEPRTLAGLSLETGIPTDQIRQTLRKMQGRGQNRKTIAAIAAGAVFTVAAIAAVVHLSAPPGVVTPPVLQTRPAAYSPVITEVPQQPGLVPLGQVTYGPDSGATQVDPTFEPPHPLPPGISISVSIGNVLWGAGDPRTTAIHGPLSPQFEKDLREDLLDLLKYVRSRAGKFGFKPEASRKSYDPTLMADGPSYPGSFMERDYNGMATSTFSIPPPGKENDAEASRIFKKVTDNFIEEFQGRETQMHSWRDQTGPQ